MSSRLRYVFIIQLGQSAILREHVDKSQSLECLKQSCETCCSSWTWIWYFLKISKMNFDSKDYDHTVSQTLSLNEKVLFYVSLFPNWNFLTFQGSKKIIRVTRGKKTHKQIETPFIFYKLGGYVLLCFKQQTQLNWFAFFFRSVFPHIPDSILYVALCNFLIRIDVLITVSAF